MHPINPKSFPFAGHKVQTCNLPIISISGALVPDITEINFDVFNFLNPQSYSATSNVVSQNQLMGQCDTAFDLGLPGRTRGVKLADFSVLVNLGLKGLP